MAEENQSFSSTTDLLNTIQKEIQEQKQVAPTPDPAPTDPPAQTPTDSPKGEPVAPQPPVTDFSVLGEEFTGKTPEQIKEEINNYKTRVQALESNTIDIDPDLYRLNILKVKDESNFNLYKNLLFGEVDTMELLKLKMVTENSLLKDEPDIDELVKEKYGLDIDIPEEKQPEDFVKDDGELDDAAYRQYNKSIDKAKKKLKVATLNAKNEAEGFRKQKLEDFKKQDVPFQTKEQRQQSLQKLDESWRPVTNNIMENFVKDKINIVVGEADKKVELEIPVNKDMRDFYTKELQNFFLNNPLPFTKDSYQQGVNYVHTLFKMQNFDTIAQKYYEKGVADEAAKWSDRGTNPSYKQKVNPNPNINTDNNDRFFENTFRRNSLGG